ncbi:gluconate 2-dehydrogenase subunit 3 family protein [Alteromonas sp. KUL49]|uniref:gluconate 2-dehydrogenase subunit 3 family protein n=1 Tax=Alteromonas sp. KUL49 TaxID=2480798 RepID=UPI0010FFAB85|nr:gluconate 2-dehydrogenase subunit 3 family protein [Alteromonas sp. KUL49]GEA10961.1 twin-arginine translocation pathway signal protein [Alteromonas sp. KUL49]
MSDVTMQSPSSELRRSILKRIGAAIGVSATGIVTNTSICSAAAFYQGSATHSTNTNPFTRDEMLTLRSVCETVIPKTDTPSAADVKCHEFIAHQLVACHTSDELANVKNIISAIDSFSKSEYGNSYIALDSQIQTVVLESIEGTKGFDQVNAQHFSFLKGLIVFGYFTSEAGATKALSYQMVPGGYKGSIPVTPETKSWGSLNYY